MMLTDEERAIFRRRLGAARVELVPLAERYREADRPFTLEARCTVGGWSCLMGARSSFRIREPGTHRTDVMWHFAHAFAAAAPHLFPVAA
jgi:hypothetical protein